MAKSINVEVNVARNLLHTAQLFPHEKMVLWEYVSNSLQYIDPEISPEVRVSIIGGKNPRIVVTDNGSGMDLKGLQNYFIMHGENQDRKTGKIGRGLFGTGKSAAFGIANKLEIVTTRLGKRSRVRLTKDNIKEAVKGGAPIPVEILEAEEDTTEPNGTTILIEDLNQKKINQEVVISYIERHLANWANPNARVFINRRECELLEPPVSFERRFSTEGELLETLGDSELIIKVSKAPLADEQQGIVILSQGNWQETT